MCLCSVIVLTYNNKLEQILLTLKSILKQKGILYEIIIADDCSDVFYEKELINFFRKYEFNNYIISRQKKNVGTVKNLYEALEQCKGKYAKPIGAGDMFFSEETLLLMCDCMEAENSILGFGLVKRYIKENEVIKTNITPIPNNLKIFEEKNVKEIYKNIIKYEQWIAGVALIYHTQKIKGLMQKMLEKIIYCEDMVTAFVLIEGYTLTYIPAYVMWYESGSGLSSRQEKYYSKRIIQDQVSLYQMIEAKEKNIWLKIGKRIIHKVKRKRVRSLLKIIFQPGIIKIILQTNSQLKQGVYTLNQTGFLDTPEFIRQSDLEYKNIIRGCNDASC